MSFTARYRNGEIPAGAIDDYIRKWNVSDLAPKDLLEHRGRSAEKYTTWQRTGNLPVIN